MTCSGCTIRNNGTPNDNDMFADSGTPFASPGSHSITFNRVTGSAGNGYMAVSLAPAN